MDECQIYGIHAVLAALRSGKKIEKIFISSRRNRTRLQELIRHAREKHIPVQTVPPETLTRKAGREKHQGVLGIISAIAYLRLEELIERFAKVSEPPLVAILDGLEDPRNVGAIIRSAESAGFHGVIVSEHHSPPFSSVVSKTSAGALYYLPIARVKNISRAIEKLKQQGFWIVGGDEKASQNFWHLPEDLPIAVVVGNEARGIRRLVKEKCDFLVRIPMYGRTESLNAAVAAALLFYELRRKRARKLN